MGIAAEAANVKKVAIGEGTNIVIKVIANGRLVRHNDLAALRSSVGRGTGTRRPRGGAGDLAKRQHRAQRSHVARDSTGGTGINLRTPHRHDQKLEIHDGPVQPDIGPSEVQRRLTRESLVIAVEKVPPILQVEIANQSKVGIEFLPPFRVH